MAAMYNIVLFDREMVLRENIITCIKRITYNCEYIEIN